MALRNNLKLMLEFSRLKTGFEQYFRVVPALTRELNEAAFRVRHSVYCEELQWEPMRDNGMESDPFDSNARQCLLQNIHNGEYVGCIRIVRPHPEMAEGLLPFQMTCSNTLYADVPDPILSRRDAIGEISRLAVLGSYRRRPEERGKAVSIREADFGSKERPRFPYIPVGLYCGMLQMARRNGLERLYILTEPSLAQHFRHLGGRLVQVGGAVEHKGQRVPYEVPVDATIAKLSRFVRPLFEHIADEVDAAYRNPGRYS